MDRLPVGLTPGQSYPDCVSTAIGLIYPIVTHPHLALRKRSMSSNTWLVSFRVAFAMVHIAALKRTHHLQLRRAASYGGVRAEDGRVLRSHKVHNRHERRLTSVNQGR